MIFEPYLGCYGSIFSPNLVCRSWDYGLSAKWSPIFNRMSGTRSNVRFILWKHITLICQHDKLPLVRIHLSQKQTDHVQIFTVYLASLGIVHLLFSVWSLNHDVICHFVFSPDHSYFITNHHKLPKFRVHMECDQTIKSHKNIKLIWGHLGYANEGQRSNLILFCIWETVGPIEPKFWYVVAERILYKKYDNYFSFWWRHHSQIID